MDNNHIEIIRAKIGRVHRLTKAGQLHRAVQSFVPIHAGIELCIDTNVGRKDYLSHASKEKYRRSQHRSRFKR